MTPWERLEEVVTAVTRYDLILAAIPLALTLGVVLGTGTPIPDDVGIAGGSVAAASAVAYSLFARPPST